MRPTIRQLIEATPTDGVLIVFNAYVPTWRHQGKGFRVRVTDPHRVYEFSRLDPDRDTKRRDLFVVRAQ